MASIALSGQDTIAIGTVALRTLIDLADGNCAELTFPNEIASVKTGKNGNSIYGYNASGQQCEVKLRLIRGSSDDLYLLGLLNAQNTPDNQGQTSFANTVLLNGVFVKVVGDGKGGTTSDTYNMGGGVFIKQVEAKSNVEGDTEQSVSIYTMRFSTGPRTLT